jgi:hypothetical protein
LYSIKNFLNQEPVAISGAVKLLLSALVVGGVVTLSVDALVAYVIALDAVLTLFVRAKSTPTVPLQEWSAAVDAAKAEGG